jgi:hypothetical protein
MEEQAGVKPRNPANVVRASRAMLRDNDIHLSSSLGAGLPVIPTQPPRRILCGPTATYPTSSPARTAFMSAFRIIPKDGNNS